MKREIKFRGLRKDGKGWVYGGFVKGKSGRSYIFNGNDEEYMEGDINVVIPETVSMYSHFRDRFGDWIHEGDIVLFLNTSFKYKVVFIDGCFKLIHIGEHKVLGVWGSIRRTFDFGFKLQVIGNIHENGGLI